MRQVGTCGHMPAFATGGPFAHAGNLIMAVTGSEPEGIWCIARNIRKDYSLKNTKDKKDRSRYIALTSHIKN
jgi:hypothetical protein